MRSSLGVILGFLLVAPPGVWASDPVPASRLPVSGSWSDSVGVSNGIPVYSTIYTTLTSSAGASQINAALAACPASNVVFLSAGTYNLNSGIDFSKSYVVLRGATNSSGVPTTILNFTSMGGERGINIHQVNDSWDPENPGQWTTVSVSSGIARGSGVVSLSGTPSGLSAGMIAWLSCPTNNLGLTGPPNGALFLGTDAFAQVVKITAVSGSTVTFTPPINADYLTTSACRLSWRSANNTLHRSGVENLSLTRSAGSGWDYIILEGTDECWVRNVKEYDLPFGNYGINVYMNYRTEIRHCDISHAETTSDSSSTYCILPLLTSGMLVEDNVFHDFPNIMPMKGLGGSAFAYNCIDTLTYPANPNWLSQTVYFHGLHNHYNLFEGNFGVNHYSDGSDAPGNNPGNDSGAMNNLYFRERLAGWDPAGSSNPPGKTDNLYAFVSGKLMNYHMVVGCVLGKQGVHVRYFDNGTGQGDGIFWLHSTITNTFIDIDNWNTVDNGVHAGTVLSAGQALVASYLHPSKPSWWGASQPWPPFGPEDALSVTNTMSYTNIPAGYRYVNGVDPATTPITPPPTPAGLIAQ